MADLPRNGELLRLARRYLTDATLAEYLGVPRTTLRDHINRLGMREPVSAVRERTEVIRPDEIPTIVRDYTDQDRHYIYPLGDVHIGSPSHDEELWATWLDYLYERPEASLLGTGDFLNTALKDSVSDVYDERMTVGDAKRKLRAQLASLATQDRIDGLVPGNHEDRITKATGDCPIRDVCDMLDVPYIQAAALIVYRVGDQEYEVFLRHGTGSGQSLVAMEKSLRVIRADIYVTAHIHNQAARVGDQFERTRGRGSVARRKFLLVTAGSFLGYERYAAQRGYAPGHMGSPRIYLDGKRHDFHVSL